MFFTRVYRPYLALRVLGALLFAFGVWMLTINGWTWWSGYVPVVLGLLLALYVRKVEIDPESRGISTTTGLWPFLARHAYTAQDLKCLKLSVNRRVDSEGGSPLPNHAIFRSNMVFGGGTWARLMTGRRLARIDKRTHAIASALGIPVEMTDGYRRYRDKAIGSK